MNQTEAAHTAMQPTYAELEAAVRAYGAACAPFRPWLGTPAVWARTEAEQRRMRQRRDAAAAALIALAGRLSPGPFAEREINGELR